MSEETIAMSPLTTMIWVLTGILISLLLPLAVRTLQQSSSGLEGRKKRSFKNRFLAAWKQYGGNRYLAILLSAALVSIVIVFLLGVGFSSTREAALAGFAWESLIYKLVGQKHSSIDT